ncbi:transcriptional regulator [candidate division BRC1 bacterium HGW-BRC1-1]|jgi:ArsR family transcriptional regulator|nr:MAG: transcriptional regulator [candidate division BRC1 bacterium HGW-BRC1-1]
MRNILAITKALSDLNRVRILCALSERGELCVCQLQELLSLAPSSTSKHLSILASAGLLSVRKEGRWAYYSVVEGAEIPEDAVQVVAWITSQAAKKKAIQQDRTRLKEILSYSPEELCQRLTNGQRCCSSAPETHAAARSRKDTLAR